MSILSSFLHKGDDEHMAKIKADQKAKREAKNAKRKAHNELKKKRSADKRAGHDRSKAASAKKS